jgi:valyl-tRNA synthetase
MNSIEKMNYCQQFVTKIRQLRNDLGIKENEQLKISANCADISMKTFISTMANVVFVNLEEIKDLPGVTLC